MSFEAEDETRMKVALTTSLAKNINDLSVDFLGLKMFQINT